MANNKIGLAYYNLDTDRYQNRNIKRLKKSFGCVGIAVYDLILCEIYRVKGCYMEWDENSLFDIAEYFGLKETLVNEVVTYCCAVGLFNRELLTSEKILTSESIQQRYIEMCTRAKRTHIEIPKHCTITPPGSDIIHQDCSIIREECQIIPPDSRTIVKQSREEKSNSITDDELPGHSFDTVWELYDKKIGNKERLRKLWDSLSRQQKQCAIEYIPRYKASQRDKQYRKNFETFLTNKSWNDEIIRVQNGKSNFDSDNTKSIGDAQDRCSSF